MHTNQLTEFEADESLIFLLGTELCTNCSTNNLS